MNLLTTSLLAVGLFTPSPNSILWNGKEMHILAELSAVRAPKQLELFAVNTPIVLLDHSDPLLQGTSESPLNVKACTVLSEFQIVDVTLPQSNQNSLQDLLHQGSSYRGLGQDNASCSPNKQSFVFQQDIHPLQEIPDSVTSRDLSLNAQKIDISSAIPHAFPPVGSLNERHSRLPLDFILGPKRATDLSERVCARLVQAEAHESNTSLRSDYRQAFICVSLASKGNTEPFLSSSYAVHGIHQDKVWPRIVNNRKERLGKLYYQFFDSFDMPRPDVKWDETPIYDLPNLAAPTSAPLSAPETGDGNTSPTGLRPSPVHTIQEKERLA